MPQPSTPHDKTTEATLKYLDQIIAYLELAGLPDTAQMIRQQRDDILVANQPKETDHGQDDVSAVDQ